MRKHVFLCIVDSVSNFDPYFQEKIDAVERNVLRQYVCWLMVYLLTLLMITLVLERVLWLKAWKNSSTITLFDGGYLLKRTRMTCNVDYYRWVRLVDFPVWWEVLIACTNNERTVQKHGRECSWVVTKKLKQLY